MKIIRLTTGQIKRQAALRRKKKKRSVKTTFLLTRLKTESMTPVTNNINIGYIKHVTQNKLNHTRLETSVTCPLTLPEVLLSTKIYIPTSLSDTTMPCHQQCNIRQLNRQLIEIKQENIFTLRQILQATTELGRVAPNRAKEEFSETYSRQLLNLCIYPTR